MGKTKKTDKIITISPVYNEEKYLQRFYDSIREFYQGFILFIDDGSTDLSSKIIKKICNSDSNSGFIRHQTRQGYGAALIDGFKYIINNNFDAVITIDVDLQHDPEYIPIFIEKLKNYDVILGSRYLQIGSCLNVPKDRLIINRYISKLLELKLNKKFSDPFCGFRAYKTTFLKNAKLEEKSYGLALEILFEIVKQNAKYLEVPIEAIYNDTKRKFLNGLDNPKDRLVYYINIIQKKLRNLGND